MAIMKIPQPAAPLQNPNLFQIDGVAGQEVSSSAISIRCPHCRELGSFAKMTQAGFSYLKKTTQAVSVPFAATIRICPNQICRGLVLVIEQSGRALKIEPPQLLDFNANNLPSVCQETLKEAVACHAAGAYRAAAMMVRRLLEEICELNKAEGANLHNRLDALRSIIVLPQALFDAMGELKALGNDAAHIEAKAYDNIGREEAEDSIELAKEILKSLYQLQGLVERLQARKKGGSTST
ncbi:MAG: DUF4145 domain-containing protein [Alphaproteobacteria bacterium]